jgi:hypothetical protein
MIVSARGNLDFFSVSLSLLIPEDICFQNIDRYEAIKNRKGNPGSSAAHYLVGDTARQDLFSKVRE